MTRPQAAADGHADLRRTLMRQFVTATDTVTLHDWPVELLRPRNSDDLISEADFVRDDRLPYWADLWPSSRILADYLLQTERAPDHRPVRARPASPASPRHQPHSGGIHAPRPRSLLELGCGLGLVTMAAMRAGYEVLATDYYEDALRFTRANAARALGREPETRHVDWRNFPADLSRLRPHRRGGCVVRKDLSAAPVGRHRPSPRPRRRSHHRRPRPRRGSGFPGGPGSRQPGSGVQGHTPIRRGRNPPADFPLPNQGHINLMVCPGGASIRPSRAMPALVRAGHDRPTPSDATMACPLP